MIKLNGVEIKLDKYPDGTFLFKDIPPIGGWCRDNIEWFFESVEEGEQTGKWFIKSLKRNLKIMMWNYGGWMNERGDEYYYSRFTRF